MQLWTVGVSQLNPHIVPVQGCNGTRATTIQFSVGLVYTLSPSFVDIYMLLSLIVQQLSGAMESLWSYRQAFKTDFILAFIMQEPF
jgi:hypothetical protein